jgi:hypothetical protein
MYREARQDEDATLNATSMNRERNGKKRGTGGNTSTWQSVTTPSGSWKKEVWIVNLDSKSVKLPLPTAQAPP